MHHPQVLHAQAVGNLASACLVGPAISYLGPRAVILGMAVLPATLAAAAAVMDEPRTRTLKHTLSEADELDQQAIGLPGHPPAV